MRIFLTIIFLFLLNITISFAKPILTEEESRSLAQECSIKHLVKNGIHNSLDKSKGLYELKYNRWDASIIEINNSGALIKVAIEKMYETKSGGKNGWGNEIISLKSDFFTCVFIGVSKGNFNVPPDYSIQHYSKNQKSIHGLFRYCKNSNNLFRSDNYKCNWKYGWIPVEIDTEYWFLEIKKQKFEYKDSYIEIGELPISHPHFD